MRITGKDLIGLTDSEILDLLLGNECAPDVHDKFDYSDCIIGDKFNRSSDCLNCWIINLKRKYEVESED